MDDLNGILKASAQHLRLSKNFDETSVDNLKEIQKTFYMFCCKPMVLDMICDALLEEGILKTFVRLWDLCHANPDAFYSNTEHVLFKNLETMKNILLNFSRKCKCLAAACFTDGALIDRLMKDFTLPQLKVQRLAQPRLSYMIEADLVILYNLVRNTNQNRNHIRRNNGIEKIYAYEKSQSLHVKACVFIVLAYCMNEEENSIITSGTGVIPFILKILESALSTPTHIGNMNRGTSTCSVSAEEIVATLNKLASNYENKKAIVDAGILPIVMKLLDPDTSSATEILEAVNLIWLLAVDTNNKQKIIQEPGLLNGVFKLVHLKGIDDQMRVAVGSLMILLKENSVESLLLQLELVRSGGPLSYLKKIRASAQQLGVSQNFDETSLDYMNEIHRSFAMFCSKRPVLEMICAILLKEDILKTFVRLWDLCHENSNAFYSNTEQVLFKNLAAIKRMLWNFSNNCKSLAAACFKDGALIDRLMKDFTLPELQVQRLTQPSLSYMIEADLSILHNLVRHVNQNRNHIRRNNGIEKIFAYEKSQSLHVKACVFIVLAYCINEEENSIITSGAKLIPFLLKILGSAVFTLTHLGNMSMSTSTSLFSAKQIVAAINKLASNDGNKKAIVDAGILPILTKLLDLDLPSLTENLGAVNLIWLLAFHTDNKQKIIQEPGLLEGVRKLRDLKGVGDRLTKAVSNLMIVLKLEQATSESHNKEDTLEANQTKEGMESVNQNQRNLLPTEAVITSAWNLAYCKRIINVVGPEMEVASDIEQKRLVASCIKNILKVAEEAKLTSIAIPAMGWVGSWINPNAVIPHIVNAVSQYFERHPKSCITRVDFVEFKNQEVLNEFQKVLSQIEIRPTMTARPTTVVQIGDIAKQNADAVVSIMAKHQIADMTKGSVIAKVLAAAAGEDVVKECAQNSGKYNDGDIFVTRAGSLQCKNIIHGIVSAYDRNSEEIVKKIVQKSLQHASQTNYRSIVFPAIGTGGFKMPPNEVAMWMKKAINNYGPKSTHVKIVLHESNPKALHAFQAEFNQANMITSSYVNYGSLNVYITIGDLLQRNDDVIVNSAHRTFDLMRAGPLSAAILRQGGSEIQNELKNSSGDMAVTSGGKLPCKHIIHLVCRTEDRQLRKTIVKVLMKADSLKASTIAFPALATGNINKPAKDAASLLHSALQEFIEKNPSPQYLKTMTVVVYNETLIQDYITIIAGYRVMRKKTLKAKARGFAEFCSSVFEKNTARQTVDFHFYASEKKDIVKALECIDKKTTEILCKEQIADSALDTVTELEMLEFQEKAEEKNVSIQKLPNNSTALLVTGLENDVKVFSDYSRNILRELVAAQTCVEFVTWEVQAEVDQKWYEFPPRPAHLLEKAYQKNKHQPGAVQVKVVENGQIISKSYDLSTLDKKNSKIRRRQTENYELPAGWDPMQGLHVRRTVLDDTSEEYKRVLNVCKKKGLPVKTATVERIQNISLYKQFATEKAKVNEKLEDENIQIERQLFHGTGKADEIVNRGFNRSFAGENGAKFGNGVYFSTSAEYSHDFTTKGARTIFVADVITGTYTQGSPGMKTAPDRSDNDLHDSVVDDVNNPTMFVVFKDASAYPTYLIEYT